MRKLNNLLYYVILTNKKKMLKCFNYLKYRIMIIITILSLELNKENINLIVYISYSFNLLNYAQESEQDDCDKRKCYVIIVQSSTKNSLIIN